MPNGVILSIPITRTHKPFFFFFNDTATTEIYTLSLHDALPICGAEALVGEAVLGHAEEDAGGGGDAGQGTGEHADRKSTRLNSSHVRISYAVFCLKKKKKKEENNWIFESDN